MNEPKVVALEFRAFGYVVDVKVAVGGLDGLWEIRRDIGAMESRFRIRVGQLESPSGRSYNMGLNKLEGKAGRIQQ